MSNPLLLLMVFSPLSMLAIGGPNAILAEMHRQTVDVHGWLTATEFSTYFGLAQAAPGPNMMVVTLIGWHVDGWAGAATASLAIFAPSSIFALFMLTTWNRFRATSWGAALQTGLSPVTVGTSAAGAALVASGAARDLVLALIVFGAFLLTAGTRIHPIIPMLLGGLVALAFPV